MPSLIPPVKITDSLDKPNPGSIQPMDTSWLWKITGLILFVITFISTYFMLMARWDYVIKNTLNTNERTLALVLTYATPLLYIGMIVAIIIVVIKYVLAKAERESLVNVNDAQITIKQLKQRSDLEIAKLKMEIELMRAQTLKYPTGVLSVQDSHNGGNTTTNNTGAENTPPQVSDAVIPLDILDNT